MTREEAVKEIEKAFEPAFANYIITALTEGATVSDKEPTTKNDLGVDCISREQAKEAIRDKFKDLPSRVEINTILNELPSVTPQKPRKGEWLRMSDLSEQEDDRYKCSRCGNVIHYKDKMNLYTFNSWCGRCGSDNGRHINYEVEVIEDGNDN